MYTFFHYHIFIQLPLILYLSNEEELLICYFTTCLRTNSDIPKMLYILQRSEAKGGIVNLAIMKLTSNT